MLSRATIVTGMKPSDKGSRFSTKEHKPICLPTIHVMSDNLPMQHDGLGIAQTLDWNWYDPRKLDEPWKTPPTNGQLSLVLPPHTDTCSPFALVASGFDMYPFTGTTYVESIDLIKDEVEILTIKMFSFAELVRVMIPFAGSPVPMSPANKMRGRRRRPCISPILAPSPATKSSTPTMMTGTEMAPA